MYRFNAREVALLLVVFVGGGHDMLCEESSMADLCIVRSAEPAYRRILVTETPKEALELRNTLFNLPDYESGRHTVAEFSRIDVNGDGREDILLLVNLSCAADPAELVVGCSANEAFYFQRFAVEHGKLSKCVRDLDDDKIYEILRPSVIQSPTTPHANALVWYDIYKWTGTRFEQKNREFPAYYFGEYLPLLARQIEVISRISHSATIGEDDKEHQDMMALVRSMLDDCRTALARLSRLLNEETSLLKHQSIPLHDLIYAGH